MFRLLWEPRRHIVLVRFEGVLHSSVYPEMDRAIVELIGAHGHADTTIYDFTETTAVAIPETAFEARRHHVPVNPAGARILVAARDDLYRESVEFARQQAALGYRAPHVVRTCEEAFALLDLADPAFEPV